MDAISRLKRIEIPYKRESSRVVHRHLREFILDGSIPPGTILSQLEISKILGVSRTPLREAFRMLQEEGLIEAEPNLRARVSAFSVEDLATIYATRIVLESLGIALTAPIFSHELTTSAEEALSQMRIASRNDDFPGWQNAHRRFHALLSSHAGQELTRQLQVLIERSERYVRVYHPHNHRIWWGPKADDEHQQLLQACILHREQEAAQLLANHLANFAYTVLNDQDPRIPPTSILTAQHLIAGKFRR